MQQLSFRVKIGGRRQVQPITKGTKQQINMYVIVANTATERQEKEEQKPKRGWYNGLR